MAGISEFVREEEEVDEGDRREGDAEAFAEPTSETHQRVDIAELLTAMKNAIEKMSVHNTHRGIVTTAGSVIIHMIGENARLIEENRLLREALEAAKEAFAPKVTLV